MLAGLAVQSAGAGIGVFVGCLIGLSIRKRGGKSEGLIGGSVVLTSTVAGVLGLISMMVFTYLSGGMR